MKVPIMIDFTLPDFTAGLKRNILFAQLMQGSPELFMPNARIHSVYGCFPDCPVNGGRALVCERYTEAQVDATFVALEQFGLKARVTFTNMLVEERHLEDPYFNMILDKAATHDAGVIVYSDLVNEYVKARHPQMERTLSTTRAIREVDELNRAAREYDMVVLDYNLNKDEQFLSQVENPQRLEVMANELCNPGCPHRQQHYLHISQDQLNGKITEFRRCNLAGRDFFKMAPTSPTILASDDVARLNKTYGIKRFKLVGRGVDEGMNLESYLYYLVRPEHRAGLRTPLAQMLGIRL